MIKTKSIKGSGLKKRKKHSRKFTAKKPASNTSGGALRAMGGTGGRPPEEEN